MDNILESAALMLQKRPPKLLKQLLYCLYYLSEDDREVVKKAYVFSRLTSAVQFRPLALYNIMGYGLILTAHFYYVFVNVSSEILNICDPITNID